MLSGVPASATLPELAPYAFTASATDSDIPAQTLSFSLADFDASNPVPAGATIGASTGLFSWTPTEAQGPGTFKFHVSVNDGLDSTTQAIVLTVTEVNSSPVLSGVPAGAAIPESAAYTFTASATDADIPVQTLTFSLTDFGASDKVPAGATIGGSTGVFNWTPTEAQGPGAYKFNVSLSDGVTSSFQTIVLTVGEVNASPVLSGVPASATIPELAAHTFTASATDADLPAQTLTFSLTDFDANYKVPPGAAIGVNTGAFNWTPTETQGPGTYKFNVSVSDGVTSTFQTIVLTVSEVNASPLLSGVPASATIPELAAHTFTASATDADLPAQTLTFSLTDFDANYKVPPGAAIGVNTGAFNWTPTETQGPGTYKFNVSVSDGVTRSFQTIVLTVSEVNTAPLLSGVPASATIPESAAYTFTAGATDSDFPEQTRTFSLTDFDASNRVPAGATIGGSTGVFSWTPTEGQGPGTYKFNVSVSDGVNSTIQTIVLTVSEVNSAPVLSGVPASATIPERAVYTFTAGATDADLPAQTLTFSLTDFDLGNQVPAGATIGGSSGVFSWTPTEAQGPGTYKFNVSLSDGVTNAAQMIVLTVSEGKSPPTDLTLSPTSVAENEPNGTVVGTFSSVDPDAGDTFAYALVSGAGSADNAAFTIVGGQLQTAVPFDYEVKSSYSIRVRTMDQGGVFTEKAFAIGVTDENEAPRVDKPILDQTIGANGTFRFVLAAGTFVDQDAGQTLSYAATGSDGAQLPWWLSFDAQTRTFSGRPLVGDVGQIRLRVTATDSGSPALAAWAEFTIAVAAYSFAWQNADLPVDVDGDGSVVALDVLLIINWINRNEAGPVPGPAPDPTAPPVLFLNVSGDDFVSAVDVLEVINDINNGRPAGTLSAEGEATTTTVPDVFRANQLDQTKQAPALPTFVPQGSDNGRTLREHLKKRTRSAGFSDALHLALSAERDELLDLLARNALRRTRDNELGEKAVEQLADDGELGV